MSSAADDIEFQRQQHAEFALIGDNSEPVQEPNGANGFTLNVANAIGTGHNGVDVDIAAQAFTGKDTINCRRNIVGGFPQINGSYVIPPSKSCRAE